MFLIPFTTLTVLAALGLGGWLLGRRTAAVRRVVVPLASLSRPLQGFTIAQIGSLQAGRGLQQMVECVNALDADVIAITATLPAGPAADAREQLEPLGRLRARHGVFVVAGGPAHGAEMQFWQGWHAELGRLGLHVLHDEHVVLQAASTRGAQTDEELLEGAILLVGLSGEGHAPGPQRALGRAPAHVATRVLLTPQPHGAATAAAFSLQLSGHGHGGALRAWRRFVSRRFGAPAGIALITLVAAPP